MRRATRTIGVLALLVMATACGRERRYDLVSQEALRHQMTTTNYTANQLKERQQETRDHTRRLAREYRKARKRMTQIKRDHAMQAEAEKRLAARLNQLKGANAKMAAQLKQLEAANKALAAKVGALAKSKQAQSARVAALTGEIKKIDGQVAALQKQKLAAQPKLKLLKQLSKRENELAQLRTRQKVILQELQSLRAKLPGGGNSSNN